MLSVNHIACSCWFCSSGLSSWYLVKEGIANIGIPVDFLVCFTFVDFYFLFLRFFLGFLESLWTSILCIVGEWVKVGSKAVAVGVCDRWQVTRNMWHMTGDMQHLTQNKRIFSSSLYSFLSVSVCYGWYYPLLLRDSVSYICGIFHLDK